ncbi:MAG: hypothetical protein KKI08_04300, partial [Armatimonadetes bacterium]|nr:hypothetical protein [Armatimonadota bacterium]
SLAAASSAALASSAAFTLAACSPMMSRSAVAVSSSMADAFVTFSTPSLARAASSAYVCSPISLASWKTRTFAKM